MLAKRYRLHFDKDIQQVLKKGKIVFGPFFNLKILSNKLDVSRFCIIISTKISKKAVVRNKAKRQLNSIIQKYLPKIKPDYDIVILTKPAVTVTEFKELEKGFTSLLQKIKLL